MAKLKQISSIKKIKKILVRTIIGLILFLLLLAIALSLPFVQTKIARIATDKLNEDFGTNINVEKVAISVFGSVRLKGVLILDHHNDTLISANRLQTNILSFKNIAESKLHFSYIKANALNFHMKTYKGENSSNFDLFIKAFDNGKPGSGKFRMKSGQIQVENGRFRLTNENITTPRVLDFKKLNGDLKDFYIKGADISADIKKLSFLDHRGLFVENIKTKFAYTKTNITLDDLELATTESALRGSVKLTYTREKMRDFLNQVDFDFNVERASVSSNELNYFYNEFGKDQKFYLSTRLKGPLNNFVLHDLKLLDKEQSEIIGTVNFRSLFNKQGPGFYMNGNFDRVSSHYNNLRQIMPRILGNSLPPILEKLGMVEIVGNVELTKEDLVTDIYFLSELGEAQTNLTINNFNKPDIATYKGVIDLDGFNIGQLVNQRNLGNANLFITVDGKGFNQKSLNTIVKGEVHELAFNGYNYKAITVDGRMKWPYFKGRINSNDPNLLMSFDGLVDMSKKTKEYDFHAKIDYADLALLKIMKKDTLSILKADLVFKASGNNLDDIAGKLDISQLSYQNSRGSYYFNDFFVESTFDEENIRTVTINSTDIIEGQVKGKYITKELPLLVENALGSLYANYSPHKVKPGQFVDFNFTVYDKIVGIVIPDITISEDTRMRGRINADNGDFQFTFNSSNITAFKNYFENINVRVNNKNPLYNAYVKMDTIHLKGYKVADFNLINITQNDTMYVRSEFKGGKSAADSFNLNLYHTIDKENKSVVGLKKSEVNFKNYQWFLNEEDDTQDNKIVFNKKLTDFVIDKISLSHNDQKVELDGVLRDSTYKDLRLTFNDVSLQKVTPSLDSIEFGGRLNGEVSLKQERNVYQPSSNIKIDSLSLNKYQLGDFTAEISGDESLRKFNVNTSIVRDYKETFFTTGNLEIVNKQTLLSLDAGFDNFDISPLQVFLKSVFPSIRGLASGRAHIVGNANNPEINGRLYLNKAGLKVGYLNTDYNFEDNSWVDLTEKTFYFRNINITDTQYGTKGLLYGDVTHKWFKDWEVNLKLESDKLVVLDTKDSDDALFYGKAFIKGDAKISGPVNELLIVANARSEEGTDIKIPINNTAAVGANASYIHFLSPKEKADRENGVVSQLGKTFYGIEMRFDLDIRDNADIEIIIDKATGHGLKATGSGNLLLEINTLGKFNMYGDYAVHKGIYNYKFGSLIDKKFEVKTGGYIAWNGDPTRATLNMEAIYKTYANPSVLMENPAFNRNIPVEVNIALTGNLSAPDQSMAINFPTASSVMKSDLEYRLNDFDTRQTQALSLLAFGTFTSPNNSGTAVYGSLFETAGSLVSGIFAEEDGKVNVGINYVNAERNPYVETNSQLGITVNSQINERITVNGQLGVPVGGSASVNESAIVGNVEVQYRLNDEGNFKARAFNRENDINFLGEGINYTQGVGLMYSVDFNTMRELWRKILGSQENKDTTTEGNDIPDSEFSPEYIKFMENRNKKKTNTDDSEPERIPETD